MTPTTASAIAELEDLPTQQLIERYEAVFREPCRSRHKRYLIRRLAWRLQAEEEGIGLSRQAKKRAAELVDEKELRVTPPRENAGARGQAKGSSQGSGNWDPRIPPPGNWLRRQYNGNTVRVLILQDGFVYEDEKYSSLSAVAKAVTGAHYNGFLFFRLGRRRETGGRREQKRTPVDRRPKGNDES